MPGRFSRFQLPNPRKDPELYRFGGPFWNRRLYILWGCEKTRNSSLAAENAIGLLEADPHYTTKKWLAALGLLLLFVALLASLFWGWPHAKSWVAKQFNKPPVAAAKLDALDITNRVATISDAGSKDPDGTIGYWLVNWGDRQQQRFDKMPISESHNYDQDGDFIITFLCVDNLGSHQCPSSHT